MLDYALVAAIAAVVREGSFERAARSLSITPSALSQRVKLLEERLGAVLVVREKPCRATELGQRLCQHAELVGLLESELHQHLLPAHSASRAGPKAGVARPPPPLIRVAVNADSLGTWFVSALAACAEATPCRFDVAVDDQDHTAEWLRRGEVLAAVTSAALPVQGCRSLPLGKLRYVATASAAFMRRHFADGVNLATLRAAPVLVYDRKDRLQERFMRLVTRRELDPPAHRLPSTQAFVDAALGGLGWGMNPLPLVQAHLAAGRLVELLPGRPVDVALHWQATRLALPQVERLTAAVLRVAGQRLLPMGRGK